MWTDQEKEATQARLSELDVDTRVFEEQARRPLAEDDCAERACKALAALGFEGMRDEVEGSLETEGTPLDPHAAWKRKLEQEGKCSSGAPGLLDLVRPWE